MAFTPLSSLGGGGGVLKILEKYLLGGQKFLFWLGGNFFGGGHRILKENLKLHNPSMKIIFRITSWIYFRCIRNTHEYVLASIPQ